MAIGLIGPSAAAAEPTELYAGFTNCPTASPEMNDPSTGTAACFSNLVRHGLMKIGGFEVELTAPMHIQFAVGGIDEDEELVDVVPGSTRLDASPSFIPNPFVTASGAPNAPAGPQSAPAPQSSQPPLGQALRKHRKKHQRKRHKHKKKHRRAAKKSAKAGQRHRASGRARVSAASENLVATSVEVAGDIREFNLLRAGAEYPGVIMKLPIKLHLEGEGLGVNCYIGSNENPIVVAPEAVKQPPSYFFGHDPNGFQVGLVGTVGAVLEDSTLTVPTATGCGFAGSRNADVNEFAGLPGDPGESRMMFSDNVFEFVESGYDGVAPEGGAELQAAFDAAK